MYFFFSSRPLLPSHGFYVHAKNNKQSYTNPSGCRCIILRTTANYYTVARPKRLTRRYRTRSQLWVLRGSAGGQGASRIFFCHKTTANVYFTIADAEINYVTPVKSNSVTGSIRKMFIVLDGYLSVMLRCWKMCYFHGETAD